MNSNNNDSYLLGDEEIGVGSSKINEIIEEVKTKKLSPFDFVNAINFTKQDLFKADSFSGIREYHSESEYARFIINKSLSYFPDTILFANLANTCLTNVPNYSHFDFLRFGITKKKRFSKWAKPIENDDLNLIMQYYQVNREKAEDVLKLLTKDQLDEIKKEIDKGGKRK